MCVSLITFVSLKLYLNLESLSGDLADKISKKSLQNLNYTGSL